MGCFPKGELCPTVCPSTPGNSSYCPVGSYCVPDHEGSPVWCWYANEGFCTDTCSPEATCGEVCCWEGLRCKDYNCCVSIIDAGVDAAAADAGVDATTSDAGVPDAGL